MIKVPGLDGSGKMGKSEGNAINLYEDPASIRKKVMRAVTDSGPTEMNQEKPEAKAFIEHVFLTKGPPPNLFPREIVIEDAPDQMPKTFRITSYNVCYTKLLRHNCWINFDNRNIWIFYY